MESQDVRRGVCRWLVRAGVMPITEASLGCGRRADVMGLDSAGRLTLVEIKVSLADLRGDAKWPEYLEWCDRFFWAVPHPLAASLSEERFAPARTGILVADRFDAAQLREAPWAPIAAARRKAQTLRFARTAAIRLALLADSEILIAAEV